MATAHKIELKALPRAAEETDKTLQRFKENVLHELNDQVPANLDVLLFGSFARRELTTESDCDYLVVLDGTPRHHEIQQVVRAVESSRKLLLLSEAGRTGAFADFATATELFARIGLESDSNANTTRRLLLLCESVPVLNEAVTSKIRKTIIERYLGDYAPDVERKRPVRVPHFLLNDVIRYWRTIAVDFGAKQWRSLSSDWYLRYAKLLTTRKILFAGTLAVLLDSDNALSPLYHNGSVDRSQILNVLSDHIETGLARTPLARLLALHDRLSNDGQRALAQLLQAYDRFIELLDDRFARVALARLGTGSEQPRAVAEESARIIHERLLFLFNDEPLLKGATREFGLF
ncbi:MAG TPA: nucleotidyltransferase domain-containing protein [Jatrophihabitans sp.]|nr:nucleotidyltransferase domain-containing protein [Jatrophihabitans sp.]